MSKKGNSNMLIPTLVLGVLAVVFLYLGYRGGEGQHIIGLKRSVVMILEIVPLLLCAFVVASMAQILIPEELLSKWIGGESGMRGIFIGAVAGGVAPGGPFVSLPVAAGLFRAGAGVGTMVAFLTGWSLWAVARIPMEIGVLGWKLTAIRVVCTFFFPPIAGLIAQALFGSVKTL